IRGQSPDEPTGYGAPTPSYGAPAFNSPANGAPGYGGYAPANSTSPGSSNQFRGPQAVSGAPLTGGSAPQSTFFQPPPISGSAGPVYGAAPSYGGAAPAYGPGAGGAPPAAPLGIAPSGAVPGGYGNMPAPPTDTMEPPPNFADLVGTVQETQTGRFQFGVGVNSDAGVTGQIVVDERNFNWQRTPTSFQDVINGTAWRGGGQGFRLEAMPGNRVQRYLVSFTEPYLFGYSPVSLNLSAFYFQRGYFDYNEERLGGRVALGYRLSPDLSVSGALRAEGVDISNPRVVGVPELDRVVGSNELYTGRVTLTHDTRDIPFFPTEGHYMEMAYEQAFGTFDYPRGELDYRRYFLVRQRPDTSGRHTLALGAKVGISGSQTPMFENYFAGGYSTLRGFDFRGASPINGGVIVGGRFRFLASAEYFFPLTADDMIKGVVFCDMGTVETDIELRADHFRVAPGFGLRINMPALGPAPLALDFAV
ncbi:MAG TPA: BamA/TamA family outer membrane protein, partial [Pirellulaceae bacterium]|nr:BamA/TamA family outer membrane protein [Pirellulaceae bacterium]